MALPLRFDLASRVHRPSGKPIVLARIATTQAQATDLLAIYLRVVNAWAAGLARINAAYAKSLSEITTDSADDIKSAMDGIAAEIQRLVLFLTPDLRQWALRVEKVHRGKWVQSVLSAADVDLNTVLTAGDVEDTVAAQIEWNVALIKDVSAEAQRRIANAVFAGLQQRKPAAEVAKEISEAVGMARSRARRIASDQTTRLGGRLNQARQEQAGITHYKWRHSAKRHPRLWHLDRDGRIFPWEGPGSIPPDDRPSIPVFCGCTAQAVVTFDDESE